MSITDADLEQWEQTLDAAVKSGVVASWMTVGMKRLIVEVWRLRRENADLRRERQEYEWTRYLPTEEPDGEGLI